MHGHYKTHVEDENVNEYMCRSLAYDCYPQVSLKEYRARSLAGGDATRYCPTCRRLADAELKSRGGI